MSAPKRIVSLLPAATEMVAFLGETSRLVGRSHECDFPPEIKSLPACTGSLVDSQLSSTAIDQAVKSISAKNAALYSLDVELIKSLKPDLIITQAQCDVCAVSLEEVNKLVADWPTHRRPQVVTLAPQRLAEVWDDLRTVSEALHLGDEGRALIRALKNRVVTVIEKTCVITSRPKVFCMEWTEPLMAAGNWVPELVELAGGNDVAGMAGQHSAWINFPQVFELNPEIIIAMPCGFDLAKTRQEVEKLDSNPAWKRLKAVRNNRVYLVDGNSYFNRPGPRLVESLEILVEILQPKLFNFGHEGKGWQRL